MNWSSNENISIAYRLLRIKGYGPVQTNRMLFPLRNRTIDLNELENEITQSLPDKEREEFDKSYELYCSNSYKVSYLSILDDHYPIELTKSLSLNAPPVLSYIGNIQLLRKKKIAYSGSRKTSEKGLWITEDSIEQLKDDDVCIVSGYAEGVDMAAHRKALALGLTTIMVLPEGISSFSIRKELRDVWDWERVLVISEFFPEDRWLAGRAMKRNQTLIGMSNMVIVIEAGNTGGSYDAGKQSIAMQKCLFVPKYAVAPESAIGNNLLLGSGAQPLTYNGKTKHTNIETVKYNLLQPKSNLLFE